MAERFLIRTQGGPADGEVRVANADGDGGWTWPLPDILKFSAAGEYVKASESDLGPQAGDSGRVRRATYRWTVRDDN